MTKVSSNSEGLGNYGDSLDLKDSRNLPSFDDLSDPRMPKVSFRYFHSNSEIVRDYSSILKFLMQRLIIVGITRRSSDLISVRLKL